MAIGAAGGNDAQGAGRMKESNIHEPWLVDVPLDWVSSRIKNVALLSPGCSGKNPTQHELCTVLPMELLSDNGTMDTSNIQSYEDVFSGLTIFEAGDVLFAKITPCMENGKGAYVETLTTRYAFGSTEYHVLRPLHKVQGKFLYYYTKSSVFREYAAENMTGAAGQKRVSSRFLKETRLFLPPLPEQIRIAAYLDASCAAIDAAVAAKKKQIEALIEMHKAIIAATITKGLNCFSPRKNSGIEWFGEIPQHWKCEHLKRVTTRIQTGVTPPTDNPDYYFEGIIPWFAPGSYEEDLELRVPRKLISKLALQENVLRMFPEQTVFLIGIGATIGKVRIITNPASCNQQIIGIVTNHKMLGRYLAYQLQTYEDIIPGIATATTLPIFDQVKTGYLPVLHPPHNEQQEICDFLDEKLANIKNILTLIESQIATLIDYRKSLIHECVTGQRRISETDVAKVERTLEQAAGLPQQ